MARKRITDRPYRFGSGVVRVDGADMKKCSECGLVKPVAAFCKDKHHATGLKSGCRICAGKRWVAWREAHPEQLKHSYRKTHYKTTYGLSDADADALAKDRNRMGTCPVCGEHTKLVIDHRHATGKMRERICSSCNSALGYLREDPFIAKALISYMKKHNGVLA